MDAQMVQERFLKVNRILGLITGVWPYQKSKTKLAGQMLSLSIMISCIITQTAKIVLFFNVDLLVNSVPYFSSTIAGFIKFGNYTLYKLKLQSLLDHVFEDWASISSPEEFDILTKYSRRGCHVALAYLLHLSVPVSLFLCLPFVPPILDTFAPLDEPRKRIFIYPAYYWLDHEEYYVLIIGHMMVAVIAAVCIFSACDTNYVYAVQHACGILAISRYRFENTCTSKDGRILSADKVHNNVCLSIQAHQRGLNYVKKIEQSHTIYLFISVGMLIMSISIALLKVAENDHEAQWAMHSMYFLAQLCHVFVLNFQGQFVINALDEVYQGIYDSHWYASSPRTQALYVLCLRSGLSPPILTAGGMITLNLRSCAEIIKASVSYYTVMQST